MEDDSWVFVSSSDESYDSDKIDSDIEAELYSVIHHGGDTVTSTKDHFDGQSPQIHAASESDKTTKKDEIWKKIDFLKNDTNLYTSFESTEKKELNGHSSSDEVQIISSTSSNCRKRKSDLLDNILESIQLTSNDGVGSNQSNCANDTSSRKKQRTNSNVNLKKKSDTKSVLNRTLEVQTSDSDSIIWSEADECDVELKTNLDNEAVVLSSDSFSSDDSFSPFLGNYSLSPISTNLSKPSTSSFTENSNDPWYVNSEDMYRSKRPSSRYHERAVLRCSNCNLKGHTVKFCSVPKAVKCYICGGSHMGSRCKDKLCHKCFRSGHDSRYCNQRLVSICVHCNMRGHSTKYCPDLWRRYHLTTNQRNIVVGNPLAQSTPIYCFNCGAKGHYGAQCQAPRADRFSCPTWTSVIAYVHPYDTVQRANDIERSTRLGGIPVWSPTPTFRPPPQQFMSPYGHPQFQTPLYRQPPPQMQMPVYNQPSPQNQMSVNEQAPLHTQGPKKKKNKKKKNSLANNLQTPGTSMKKKKKNSLANNLQTPVSMKKQKNKGNSASQTPESSTKNNTQKEVYFPRTPKTYEKRLQKKLRKQEKKLQRNKIQSEKFMQGLHSRLGLFN